MKDERENAELDAIADALFGGAAKDGLTADAEELRKIEREVELLGSLLDKEAASKSASASEAAETEAVLSGMRRGLADGLESETLRPSTYPSRPLLAAAAAVLVAFGLWSVFPRGDGDVPGDPNRTTLNGGASSIVLIAPIGKELVRYPAFQFDGEFEPTSSFELRIFDETEAATSSTRPLYTIPLEDKIWNWNSEAGITLPAALRWEVRVVRADDSSDLSDSAFASLRSH